MSDKDFDTLITDIIFILARGAAGATSGAPVQGIGEQSLPVIVSVKEPLVRFSTPTNVSDPLSDLRAPEPVTVVELDVNAPVATSSVPVTGAVRLPTAVAMTMSPAKLATVPSRPVVVNVAVLVPRRTPWLEIVAVV